MSIWQVIWQEIRYRKLNFGLAVVAVAIATGCAVGVMLLLRLHDLSTHRLLEERRAEIQQRGELLQDDMRKISKGLGYNLLILPAGQNLADVYAEGYAEKTMPEEYVQRLSEMKSIQSVEHLLPALEQKVEWPELKRTVIVTGIRGEVPFMGRKAKAPILTPVPKGAMVLGFELHRQLQLKKGDEVTFMGRRYRVGETYAQRGNKDDITLWIPLKDAQQLFKKEGRINAIWALNCNCFSNDMMGEVRGDIAQCLPDTQVIELSERLTARAQARRRAYQDATAALEEDQRARAAWRHQIEAFGSILVPIVVIGGAVWIALLALLNARDRRSEIGILRAIGVKARTIAAVFLGKAALIGVIGGVAGCVLGGAAAGIWSRIGGQASALPLKEVFTGTLGLFMLTVIICAPVLCMMATWLPAQFAAQLDPALVLREE
jgi:ABC-type lipoprotein release transport system permease subunit